MAQRLDVLTADEVATELRISGKTVRRMAKDGRLRAVKVGTHWRFHWADVKAFAAGLPQPGK